MTNLVLLLIRVSIETNFIPGYSTQHIGPITTNASGYLEIGPSLAININHKPRNEVVTNYFFGIKQGTNTIELLTITKK